MGTNKATSRRRRDGEWTGQEGRCQKKERVGAVEAICKMYKRLEEP
jgi:hypothetical protein